MMHNQIHHLKFFLFLCLSWWTYNLRAQVLPDIQWKIMEGPHFDLIYNSEQQALADGYFAKAEEAWQRLNPVFSAKPERTVVILNDSTDLANGYATRIPYPHMMLYPVLPGPMESIAEYGDWPLEFVLHEYTHVLSFEPANGVFRVLRWGFGTIMAPNLLLPRWYLEGVAVEDETRLSDHGRLRSTYQDAVFRAMQIEGNLAKYKLAEQNEIWTPNWPSGARPYLFGSVMWSQMIASSSPEIIDELHQAYGGRLPYTIEAPLLMSKLGLNYQELYDRTIIELDRRIEKQIHDLGATAFSNDLVLPIKGKQSFAPSISPDQKVLAFISENEIGDKNVKIIERQNLGQSFSTLVGETEVIQTLKDDVLTTAPKSQDAPPGGTISRMSWFPDSKKFVYDKIHKVDPYRLISDLYVYDLTEKKSKNLTDHLRAREPAVSPDGSHIVFVKLSGGLTQLATILADGTQPTILYTPALQNRLSFPVYLSNDRILFSERDGKGFERFMVHNLKDSSTLVAYARSPQVRFASLTPKGLIFTSSANGVNNVYISDDSFTKIRPLTHLATSAFITTYDTNLDELYFTKMTAAGNKISMIPMKTAAPLPSRLPSAPPLLADRYPAYSESHPNSSAPTPKAEPKDYSPLPYLWPHYWIPSFYQDTAGFYFQILTSGQDPLGKHRYSLQLGWDSYLGRSTGALTYINSASWWQWSLLASDRYSYLITKEDVYRDTDAALLFAREFMWRDTTFSPLIGWTYKRRKFESAPLERSGPTVGVASTNIKQTPAQISPESGNAFQLSVAKYLPASSDLEYEQWSFQGAQFFSYLLPKRHAIMARFSGTNASRSIPFIFGTTTVGGNYSSEVLPAYNLLRGYPTGQLLGKSLYTANLEYRLPLADHYFGWNTWAFFIRRSHLALFADVGATDGRTYNQEALAYEGTSFSRPMTSVGAEYKLDTTTGNVIPLRFIFGLYRTLTDPAKKETSVFFGLQI